MDENKGGSASDPREELREQLQVMGKAAGELLEQLVKVPATLAQIPLQALPESTADHARNAAREGFEAVRSLLEAMTKGIEQVMNDVNAKSASTSSNAEAPTEESDSESGWGNTQRIDVDIEEHTNGNGSEPGQPTTRLDL